jgi:hypothetical protein
MYVKAVRRTLMKLSPGAPNSTQASSPFSPLRRLPLSPLNHLCYSGTVKDCGRQMKTADVVFSNHPRRNLDVNKQQNSETLTFL